MQLADQGQYHGDLSHKSPKVQVCVGLAAFAVILVGVAHGLPTTARSEHATTVLRAVAPAPASVRVPTRLRSYADRTTQSRSLRPTLQPSAEALHAQTAPASGLELTLQPETRMRGWFVAGAAFLVVPFVVAMVRRIAKPASMDNAELKGSQWSMAAVSTKEYLFTFGTVDGPADEAATEASDETALRDKLMIKWQEMQARESAVEKLLQEWSAPKTDTSDLTDLRADLLQKWEVMQSRQRAVEQLLQEWAAPGDSDAGDLATLQAELMQKWKEMQSRERAMERLLEEWRDNAFMQVSDNGSDASNVEALREELMQQWQEVRDREDAVQKLLQELGDVSGKK